MKHPPRPQRAARWLALLALLAATNAAQAAITVYDDAAAFAAAVTQAGSDDFDGLAGGALAAPQDRSAGPHRYRASDAVDPALYGAGDPLPPGAFYVTGSGTDRWLSGNAAGDTLSFMPLDPLRAIGGLFFGTDIDGAVASIATLRLVATDSAGSLTRLLLNPGNGSFLGFVSDLSLVSLSITGLPTGFDGPAFATVNNLVLATPVPEPQTAALLLGGLGLLALRRRRPAAPTASTQPQ